MGNAQTIFYLLMGISGVGIIAALVVMLFSFLNNRSAAMQEEDAEDFDYEDVEDYGDYAQEETPQEDSPQLEEPQPILLPDEELSVTVALDQAVGIPAPVERQEPPITLTIPGEQDADVIDEPKEEAVIASGHPVGPWRLRVSSAQHIGARKEQQDAMDYFAREDGLLCVLCDGMGGMRMGGEAARIAAKFMTDSCRDSSAPLETAMGEALTGANEKVWELCRTDDLEGAGTTMVAASVTPQGFSFLSVGDSHVYLLRNGVLSQLNEDHNYFTELLAKVRAGEITREEALTNPERAHLTSFLGMRRLSMIDRSSEPIDLHDGDAILLASDGLFKVLRPKEIAERLAAIDETCAQGLVDEVLMRKYRNQDNISVMLITVERKG